MKNIIYKLFAAALVIAMLLPLASCSDENNPTVAKVGGRAVSWMNTGISTSTISATQTEATKDIG